MWAVNDMDANCTYEDMKSCLKILIFLEFSYFSSFITSICIFLVLLIKRLIIYINMHDKQWGFKMHMCGNKNIIDLGQERMGSHYTYVIIRHLIHLNVSMLNNLLMNFWVSVESGDK